MDQTSLSPESFIIIQIFYLYCISKKHYSIEKNNVLLITTYDGTLVKYIISFWYSESISEQKLHLSGKVIIGQPSLVRPPVMIAYWGCKRSATSRTPRVSEDNEPSADIPSSSSAINQLNYLLWTQDIFWLLVAVRQGWRRQAVEALAFE